MKPERESERERERERGGERERERGREGVEKERSVMLIDTYRRGENEAASALLPAGPGCLGSVASVRSAGSKRRRRRGGRTGARSRR